MKVNVSGVMKIHGQKRKKNFNSIKPFFNKSILH